MPNMHTMIVIFVALAIGYFLRPYFPQPAALLGM